MVVYWLQTKDICMLAFLAPAYFTTSALKRPFFNLSALETVQTHFIAVSISTDTQNEAYYALYTAQ